MISEFVSNVLIEIITLVITCTLKLCKNERMGKITMRVNVEREEKKIKELKSNIFQWEEAQGEKKEKSTKTSEIRPTSPPKSEKKFRSDEML